MAKVYVAINIKKAGDTLLHPIVEIGVAIGTKNEKPVVKKRWSIECNAKTEQAVLEPLHDLWQIEYKDRRDHFQREFWQKEAPSLWDDIQNDPATRPAHKVYPEIAEYLSELYSQHADQEVVWLSGNPAFDLGHLDFWLIGSGARLAGCAVDAKLNQVSNPHERLKGMSSYQIEEVQKVREEAAKKAAWCKGRSDSDAEWLLLTQLAIDEVAGRYALGPNRTVSLVKPDA